jgi:hypothetical protein
MVVPLLQFDRDNCKEVRFGPAGNRSFGSWPEIDAANVVATFLHYSLLKMNKQKLFTNLQGMFFKFAIVINE